MRSAAMFKLGFSTIGCPDYGIDQVIVLARANRFSGVEIRHLHGTVDLPSLAEFSSPAGLSDTRRRFKDAGIEVVGINTGVRMNSLDAATREKNMMAARSNLAIAEALGARYLRLFGGPIPPEQDREKTLDAIAAGLGRIADMTMPSGVQSLVETHDDFCKAPAVLDLYKRGASKNLGVLWDTLHSYRHGETAEQSWSQLGDRIRLVHVKDAYKATPTAFDFALTGEGSVPIMSFVNVLRKNNYNGYVNFEWEKGWHREIAEPEVAIPHFAKFMAARL